MGVEGGKIIIKVTFWIVQSRLRLPLLAFCV